MLVKFIMKRTQPPNEDVQLLLNFLEVPWKPCENVFFQKSGPISFRCFVLIFILQLIGSFIAVMLQCERWGYAYSLFKETYKINRNKNLVFCLFWVAPGHAHGLHLALLSVLGDHLGWGSNLGQLSVRQVPYTLSLTSGNRTFAGSCTVATDRRILKLYRDHYEEHLEGHWNDTGNRV